MAVTDELQKLIELKNQGLLSEVEFSQAKNSLLAGPSSSSSSSSSPSSPSSSLPARTAAEQRGSSMLDPAANMRAGGRLLVLLAVLGGAAWLGIRSFAGEKAANRVVAAAVRAPMTLNDSVENVRASSWQGIGINVPYAGELTVEVTVKRGNAQIVHLLKSSEIDAYKARKTYRHFPEFEAGKTKLYKRSARVDEGGYYLVVEDKTLGLLSASASDVAVVVRIAP